MFFLFLCIGIVSCQDKKENEMNKKQEHTSRDLSPCEFLTNTEIKNALDIPADAQTSKVKKNTTYPSCFYKWESITFPYEVYKGRMADYPAELSIVLATNINKKLYEQSIAVYKDAEAINDVGEMATWSKKMSQITFLYNNNLIHVHTKISADAAANKSKSIKIAKLIIERL